jgi:hypothetical protein
MSTLNPVLLMVSGAVLLILAVVLSFALVLRLVEPSFFLVFVTYGASFFGLMIGIVGIARLGHWGRR